MQGRADLSVHAIRYDSRRVAPGDLYVAINGRDDHALEYVEAAVEAGASVVVTDAPERIPPRILAGDDVTVVVVDDARRAMAEMALLMHGNPERRLRLLGVTGTNGKTTVTYLLRQLLEACGERVGVIGTLGKMLGRIVPTGYTTPESPELAEILEEMADGGFTTVAMEVSSHALALERVAGLGFDGAIFTNLTQDHLDFHQSMQEYHDAKKSLFDRLDRDRTAVVNIDDIYGESMVRDTHARVLRYGVAGEADLRIARMELGAVRSHWELIFSDEIGGGSARLSTPLLGAFNVSNVTAALGLALGLGYDRRTLLEAVETLRPVPGRMESITLGNGATAVVDYAHTPDALENVLASLRRITGQGSAITVVFGCGGDRDRAKRPMMGSIARRLADRVIVTSDNPRSEDPAAIIEDVVAGMEERRGVETIADRRAAIERALDESGAGDLVVIACKGHEDYQIIGGVRHHFDDREVVRGWVAARQTGEPEGVEAE